MPQLVNIQDPLQLQISLQVQTGWMEICYYPVLTIHFKLLLCLDYVHFLQKKIFFQSNLLHLYYSNVDFCV